MGKIMLIFRLHCGNFDHIASRQATLKLSGTRKKSFVKILKVFPMSGKWLKRFYRGWMTEFFGVLLARAVFLQFYKSFATFLSRYTDRTRYKSSAWTIQCYESREVFVNWFFGLEIVKKQLFELFPLSHPTPSGRLII